MAAVILFGQKQGGSHARFDQMCRALEAFLRTNYGSFFVQMEFLPVTRGRLAILRREEDGNIFHREEDGSWLAVEGSVFALNETKVYNASELWQLYRRKGKALFDQLDGHYVIKLYDAQKDIFVIGNDIIKSRINYIAEKDGLFMVTPFALTCSAFIKPQPDLHALNELFWRYYLLSERTVFTGVDRLQPASVYTVDREIVRESYWQFPDAVTPKSFRENVELMVQQTRETARLLNKLTQNPCMDLTLGQDSRLLVASFRSQGLGFNTSTYGKDDFVEVAKVRELVKRHNIEHHTIQLKDDFRERYAGLFEKALLLGSGDEPGYLLGRILYMREQQAQYGDSLINGAGGPFYKDCFWEEVYTLNLYREPGKINPSMFLKLRPLNKNYPDSFFNDTFMKVKADSADYFLDMLNDSISGYEHLPVSMQIDKFSLTRWQNYAVIANSVANSLYRSFSPLLLRRNLEIGLPLPPKWRWNKSNFQRAVMYAIDPKLARERTDFGGINMVPKNALTFIPFYLRYAWKQSARMRNKLLNKAGVPVKTHLQAAWDYMPLYRHLLADSPVADYLANPEKLSAIIEKPAFDIWLDDLRANEGSSLHQLEHALKLAGLEFLLRWAEELYDNATIGK